MLHTFKTSVFTLFQLGGVENPHEFSMSRSSLRKWPSDLQGDEDEDKDVRHNNMVLQDLLL